MSEIERSLAVFIDFENLALGFQGRRDRFDIDRVLERLVEKGKVVAKKAYADWSRFAPYTAPLHEAAIELIEIPRRAQSGKNSADIRLCVDAMDLAYSKEHIDTFVVVSGDSDFSPLVSKRKELSFSEAYHGYRTFSELIEDAQKEGLLELETDKRSRTYVVTRFGAEMQQPGPAAPEAGKKKSRRRRSSNKRRGNSVENGA